MAYTPQEWRNGDTDTPLSADRLLHIEQGIEDAHDGIAGKADTGDIPDVSGLATKAEVTSALAGKADASAIPDVTGLATKAEMTAGLAGKADTADIPDVSGLATQAALAALVARVEALETAE